MQQWINNHKEHTAHRLSCHLSLPIRSCCIPSENDHRCRKVHNQGLILLVFYFSVWQYTYWYTLLWHLLVSFSSLNFYSHLRCWCWNSWLRFPICQKWFMIFEFSHWARPVSGQTMTWRICEHENQW